MGSENSTRIEVIGSMSWAPPPGETCGWLLGGSVTRTSGLIVSTPTVVAATAEFARFWLL